MTHIEEVIEKVKSQSQEDLVEMVLNYMELSKSLHYKSERLQKEKGAFEDKLEKAQSYIVDLENQLKNKENGWMNK